MVSKNSCILTNKTSEQYSIQLGVMWCGARYDWVSAYVRVCERVVCVLAWVIARMCAYHTLQKATNNYKNKNNVIFKNKTIFVI